MAAPCSNTMATAVFCSSLRHLQRNYTANSLRQLSPAILSTNRSDNSIFRGMTPCRAMCYEARQVDIAAGKQAFMFDTHALIRKLETQGFMTPQAEAIAESLVQICRASDEYQSKNLVTKAQQEILMQQVMSHIAAVRKDMVILEKSEFSQLKHEYEKQSIDIKQLKQTLNDEVQKLKSSIKLDMSLERARVQEGHGTNERDLAKLNNKLDIHETEVEKMYSQVDSKIDREVARLLATFERYKTDTIKYAGGTILTCLTVCLGFYRLWKG